MDNMTEYKPYILLIMFSIAVIMLEMSVYHGEIATVTEQQIGIENIPTMPTDKFWNICIPLTSLCIHIPDIIAWFGFFVGMIGYLFMVLSIALTLPIDSIPAPIKILILAPIWIMVVVLAYNATRAFIRAIGSILPV